MKNVLCILLDGFEELEAVGTIALLKRAGINVDIATDGKIQATGRYGMTLSDIYDLNSLNYNDYDMLFVPGGPHYAKILKNDLYLKIIKYYFENKSISTICAGPTILGKLGLLKGKSYTCFESMNDDFGGNYVGTYAVLDGNLITGKSAAATIEFGFMIIKFLLGEEKDEEIKKQIYYKDEQK